MPRSKSNRSAKTPSQADKTIGQNLRTIRRGKGLTQSALGDLVDLTFQQIQKYERGVNRIASGRLPCFAEALNCDVSEFYEGVVVGFNQDDIPSRKIAKEKVKLKDAKRQLIKLIHESTSIELIQALSTMLESAKQSSNSIDRNCA